MGGLIQDTRHAARALRGSWLVTLLAAASIALAIPGNTTVFSLVSAIVFHTWPYDNPEQLVAVFQTDRSQDSSVTLVSPANFVDWRARQLVSGDGVRPGVTLGQSHRWRQ